MEKRVILTDQEIQAALELFDAAVRHLGINAAHAAAALTDKLRQAEEVEDDGDLPED
jgi:hypothetical protein